MTAPVQHTGTRSVRQPNSRSVARPCTPPCVPTTSPRFPCPDLERRSPCFRRETRNVNVKVNDRRALRWAPTSTPSTLAGNGLRHHPPSKLKSNLRPPASRWAPKDARKANGGLGECYSERETRAPVWVVVGDTVIAAELVGLSDAERAGAEANPDVVELWLDDGVAPNGASGRAFGTGSVHGFDLTFCAPKSVSLLRGVAGEDVIDKAVAQAHSTALREALEYLAQHAGYARVHNRRRVKRTWRACRGWWPWHIGMRRVAREIHTCIPT
jgi:TrwC relaxase